MMVRACGHSQWVNSPALAAAKISRNTPDPAGGKIDRDSVSGEPTGMLRELRYLIERVIPVPSLEERRKAVLLAQKHALRLGITGVHTCERFQQWEAFEALDREGALKVRVYHLLPPDDLDEAAANGVRPGHGSERLWAGHMKLYADGSLGAGTARCTNPTRTSRRTRGWRCWIFRCCRKKSSLPIAAVSMWGSTPSATRP